MLDLLWRGVHLLLTLLGAAAQTKDEMEGRLFLDVVVGEGAAVFELLAGEDESLLVGRDAFLVCGTKKNMSIWIFGGGLVVYCIVVEGFPTQEG